MPSYLFLCHCSAERGCGSPASCRAEGRYRHHLSPKCAGKWRASRKSNDGIAPAGCPCRPGRRCCHRRGVRQFDGTDRWQCAAALHKTSRGSGCPGWQACVWRAAMTAPRMLVYACPGWITRIWRAARSGCAAADVPGRFAVKWWRSSLSGAAPDTCAWRYRVGGAEPCSTCTTPACSPNGFWVIRHTGHQNPPNQRQSAAPAPGPTHQTWT